MLMLGSSSSLYMMNWFKRTPSAQINYYATLDVPSNRYDLDNANIQYLYDSKMKLKISSKFFNRHKASKEILQGVFLT